ncbi:MAG TPA: hypothetical protein VFE14_11925, partial [Micromonosporaceae bacterium]|nr:hypothetical protein [Micromonosporaceae bacterium]
AAAGETAERLLAGAGQLRIVATSRRPLGVAGEREFPLGPLPVPAPDADDDPLRLTGFAAVQLLVERIAARRPGFVVDAAGGPVLARLCRRLGGVPLALELAAAQCRVRDPADLLGQPMSRLLDLADTSQAADHARLRTAIAGSVGLLDPETRRAFGCLSAFAGGWAPAGGVAVLAELGVDAGGVYDTLAAHGVITREAGGTRLAMLDTIREYAAECAVADGVAERAAHRHAAYVDELVASTTTGLAATLAPEKLAVLDAEWDNIRAALGWFRRTDRVAGLRMVEALRPYWFMRSRWTEALSWLDGLLGPEGTAGELDPTWAGCGHRYAAVCAIAVGDYPLAYHHATLAVRAAERAGSPVLLAAARSALGRTLFYRGEAAEAESQLRAALDVSIHYGHWAGVLTAAALADLLSARGDVVEAGQLAVRARDVALATHTKCWLPWAWHALARTAWRAGNPPATRRAATQMLAGCENLGDCPAIRLRALTYLAAGAAADRRLGEARRAVALAGQLAARAGREDRALAGWAAVELALAAGDGTAADGSPPNEALLAAATAALPEVVLLPQHPYLIDVLTAVAAGVVADRPILAAHATGVVAAHRARYGVAPTRIAESRLRAVARRGRDLLGADRWAEAVRQGASRSASAVLAHNDV